MGFFDKIFKRSAQEEVQKEALNEGLQKTKENFLGKLTKAVAGKSIVDEEVLDQLEEALITADVGLETTIDIIKRIEARVAKDKYVNTADLSDLLQQEIADMLPANVVGADPLKLPAEKKPYILLVVGVNGVGKTTTIGKLAQQFKDRGYSVVLGAGDTFRAAAVDQLTIWSERVGVPIVKKEMGSDPSSVVFDAVGSAIARNADILIIDTAGRLHNKVHLMEELSKIKRVIGRQIPDAPHEVMLVLDGSTGQNALEQAKQFTTATEVSSLAITKLDGTAKGGVVLSIAHHFQIPVKYIGVGEKIQDLQVFDKLEFIDTLFTLK